jgi:aspartate/tyrosine/aromatic aminotransferase
MDGLIRPEVELLISTSFSKSFALYSERVGALLLVARSEQDAAAAQSNVKVAIRANYSNPPSHGGDIVATILGDRDLSGQWEAELAGMRTRIKDNRARLVEALTSRAIPGDWAPIASQRGLFALLGLSLEQAARLREEHAVYVVGRGRINVAGFTTATFGRFADALAAVLAE